MKAHLIAVAKKPVAGYAKTRLGQAIGFEEAAGAYARFLYGCLLELVQLAGEATLLELCLASAADIPYFRRAFPEFSVTAQIEGDLGERLAHSMRSAFAAGAEAVVITSTDIPGLTSAILQSALQALKTCDVVLGPCPDGGYYLVGTRCREANLFQDIDWSSAHVLGQTEALIRPQGLSLALLPVLADIDTGADFQRWLKRRNPFSASL